MADPTNFTSPPSQGLGSVDPTEMSMAWSAQSMSVPADVVQRFALEWESAGQAPGFDRFLSTVPAMRRLSLLELIKVDMHYRWLRFHQPKRLADYVLEHPELAQAPLPPDLIVEEFLLRRKAGDRVEPDEYLLLYPEHAARLRRMLGDSEAHPRGVRGRDSPPSESHRSDIDGDATGAYGAGADEDATGVYGAGADEDATGAYRADGADADDDATGAYDGLATGAYGPTDLPDLDATAQAGARPASTGEPWAVAGADVGGAGTGSLPEPGTPVAYGPDGHAVRPPRRPPDTSADPSPSRPRRVSLNDLDAGQQVGDFDLLLALGRGAFARVFLARQRSMQRLVAVKVSRDHGTEPQTLAQLDHDYIVRVFDQRYLPSHRLRLLYMQYLPGGTLQGVLQRVRATAVAERSGKLLLEAVDDVLAGNGEIRPTESSLRATLAAYSWPEAVAWLGRCLAQALDHAAAHSVLHRDVKPANILLTAEGVPKLADFNISFSSQIAGDSPVAYFGGSLAYMSPEQMEACHPRMDRSPAELDTRSDIYALGVVLWELLTGARPFDDETTAGESLTSLGRMLDRRRGGLSEGADGMLPPDCPAALRRVLRTCLEVDPANRWSSGAELAQQFELCLDKHARELVDPPPTSRRARLSRWMTPMLIAAVAGPNMLSGIYNYLHNKSLIISKLDPFTQRQFELSAIIINVTLWPIGAALLVYFLRYALRVNSGLRKGRTFDPKTLARARRDSLLFGDRAVAVTFALWFIAGFYIPISLELIGGDLPTQAYLHFFVSLTVCGAMAAVYPFFLVNFYMMRCLFPIFLIRGQPSADDVRTLRGVRRRSMFYLPAAASIPLIGVVAVSFLSPEDLQAFMLSVGYPAVISIGAYVAVYALYRLMEDDIHALERVVAKGGR